MKNDLEKPHGTTRTVFGQARQHESAGSSHAENHQRGRLFKICPECGAKNPGSSEFCSVDGVALDLPIASVTALPVKNTRVAAPTEKPELESPQPEVEQKSSSAEKENPEFQVEIKRFSNWNDTEKKRNSPKLKPRYGVWLGFAAIAAAVLWFSIAKFQSTEGFESQAVDVFSPEPAGDSVDDNLMTSEAALNAASVKAEALAEPGPEIIAPSEKAQSKPELKAATEREEIEPVNGLDSDSSAVGMKNDFAVEPEAEAEVVQQALPKMEETESVVALAKEKKSPRNSSNEDARSEFLRELNLLLVDNGYEGFSVTVSSANIVTLKGVVSDFTTKENVLSLVNGYDGVVRVRDKIFVFE